MNLRRILERMSSVANNAAARMSIFLFLVMTLIVWAQIFYRFILGGGIVWAEEVAKFLMVWMALLGAAVLYYEGGHIAINFLIARRPGLRYIQMFHALLASALFALLIYYGINYATFGLRLISPASGIKKFWPYLAIPVGGGFLFFQSMIRFIQLALGYDQGHPPHEHACDEVAAGKDSVR